MAVPKRKMSRSNTRHRRSQWAGGVETPQLSTVTVGGRKVTVPRRLAKAYQRGLIEPG